MKQSPKRIQRKREKGWRKPDGAVIVDRTSWWANPWVVKREPHSGVWQVRQPSIFGAVVVGRYSLKEDAQAYAVRAFDYWLHHTCRGGTIKQCAREELRGKDLVCWCKPGDPCHADVLLRVANEETGGA